MLGVGLSRWTMAHFHAALACFLLAQLLMLTGFAYPAAPLLAPDSFIAVHLLTIGWLSLLMFGALYQFVPVLTSRPLPTQKIPLATFLLLLIGLAGMIAGFLALAGHILPAAAAPLLPLGGGLVVLGMALGAGYVLTLLWRARPLSLAARFVAAGQCFLLITVSFGLCFALALTLPTPPDWLAGLLAQDLHLHVLAGLAGWFTLTAIGVSYRLLSMFMLAPEQETLVGDSGFYAAVGGLALMLLGGLPMQEAAGATLTSSGAGLLGLGLILYLAEVARLYHQRQRRQLELNSLAAIGALVSLGLALLLAAALYTGLLPGIEGPLGYLVLFGWLSGLGLTQLYKIVPFLTWLQKVSPKLGKGRLPRVQDLVVERRARPWFVLFFLGVALGTLAGLIGLPLLWRAAVALHLLASLVLASELWRTRHLDIDALTASLAAPATPRPFARPARTPQTIPRQEA